VAVLREGFAQLGWTEPNIQIEDWFAGGDADQMQAYAAELVSSAPDVIVANSTPLVNPANGSADETLRSVGDAAPSGCKPRFSTPARAATSMRAFARLAHDRGDDVCANVESVRL
jgi:hypothetical protein